MYRTPTFIRILTPKDVGFKNLAQTALTNAGLPSQPEVGFDCSSWHLALPRKLKDSLESYLLSASLPGLSRMIIIDADLRGVIRDKRDALIYIHQDATVERWPHFSFNVVFLDCQNCGRPKDLSVEHIRTTSGRGVRLHDRRVQSKQPSTVTQKRQGPTKSKSKSRTKAKCKSKRDRNNDKWKPGYSFKDVHRQVREESKTSGITQKSHNVNDDDSEEDESDDEDKECGPSRVVRRIPKFLRSYMSGRSKSTRKSKASLHDTRSEIDLGLEIAYGWYRGNPNQARLRSSHAKTQTRHAFGHSCYYNNEEFVDLNDNEVDLYDLDDTSQENVISCKEFEESSLVRDILSSDESGIDDETKHTPVDDAVDTLVENKNNTNQCKVQAGEKPFIIDIPSEDITTFPPKTSQIGRDTITPNSEEPRLTDPPNSVRRLFLREALRPDNLRAEFRLDFREASCQPRRFIINVSRMVKHRLALLGRLEFKSIPRVDVASYLVFVFCRSHDEKRDEYMLWVNSVWTPFQICANAALQDLHPTESSASSIGDLIQQAIDTVDTLGNDLVPKARRRSTPAEHPFCMFFLLRSMAKWKTSCIRIAHNNEWIDPNELLPDTSGRKGDSGYLSNGSLEQSLSLGMKEKPTTHLTAIRGPRSPSMCGICLKDSGRKSKRGLSLMSLDACSHWFCNACWVNAIKHQFKTPGGTTRKDIVCIEKNCCSLIEPMALLTLMDVSDIRQMNEGKLENTVASIPFLKVCPSVPCDRLLMVNPSVESKSTHLVCITCRCFHQFCFTCLRPPHWPASCQDTAHYRNLLKSGDDVLSRLLTANEFPLVSSDQKCCPRCGAVNQRPTINSARSNYSKNPDATVMCGECGCSFCWRCCQIVSETGDTHEHEMCKHSVGDQQHGIQNGVVSDNKLTTWFNMALVHRKMRHPQVMVALYVMADDVASNIQSASRDGCYYGDARKAASGWKEEVKFWSQEALRRLRRFHSGYNSDVSNHISHIDGCPPSRNSLRPDSVASMVSACSDVSVASECSDDNDQEHENICKAACNIVHILCELHHVIEYACVMLDRNPGQAADIQPHLHKSEDLCDALTLLLQSGGASGICRVLPTFLRLQVQAKQVIGTLVNMMYSKSSGHL